MRKLNFIFIAFIFAVFLFHSSCFSQTYELLSARFSAGGVEQKSVNYDVKSSTGGMTKVDAESANFDVGTAFTPPDSLPAVPFAGAVSMVSIPLMLENQDAYSLFGSGFDIAKWAPGENAYHFYLKNAADTLLQLNAGYGYWLKLDSAKDVTVYGSLVSTSSDYAISLKAGWNQIGNPFNFNVDFSDVKVKYQGTTKTLSEAADAGWLGKYAFSYPNASAGYQLIHPTANGAKRILEPWLGYWVNSAYDLDILIPPTQAVKTKESIAVEAGSFGVVMKVETESSTSSIIVGKGKQTELIPKPPDPVTQEGSVYLAKGSGQYLAEYNDSLNYEFVVLAKQGEKTTISVAGNNLPNGELVYLTDLQTNKETNLSKTSYAFTADGTEKRFKAQITKAEKELFTQSLSLDEVMIYPNPVRGNVSIGSNVNIVGKFSMGLPVSADMEFYTLGGKLIQKEPLAVSYGGKGKVKLDTQNTNNVFMQLPNGVYVVRVTFYNALGEKASKVVKIVVVK